MILDVLVPRPDTVAASFIMPGSGIVGSYREENGPYVCDFEGNLYGADVLKTHEQRVVHAAGRHAVRYPTVARAHYPKRDFIVVGSIDTDGWRVMLAPGETEQAALKEWLGDGEAGS